MPSGSPQLSIPQVRVAPPDVVRQLREILPSAELVYMGEGRWLLGEVERSNVRLRLGRKRMAAADAAPISGRNDAEIRRKLERWRFVRWEGELLAQGFASIAQYENGDPDSRIVEDLRRNWYTWVTALDEQERQLKMLDAAEEHGIYAEEQGQDAASRHLTDEALLREAHRWAFRKPVSVINTNPLS